MHISSVRSYLDLEQYLQEYITFDENVGQFDFNGVLHLLRALVDNLARNYCDGDIEVLDDFCADLEPKHKAFLRKLVDG